MSGSSSDGAPTAPQPPEVTGHDQQWISVKCGRCDRSVGAPAPPHNNEVHEPIRHVFCERCREWIELQERIDAKRIQKGGIQCDDCREIFKPDAIKFHTCAECLPDWTTICATCMVHNHEGRHVTVGPFEIPEAHALREARGDLAGWRETTPVYARTPSGIRLELRPSAPTL